LYFNVSITSRELQTSRLGLELLRLVPIPAGVADGPSGWLTWRSLNTLRHIRSHKTSSKINCVF